MTKKASVLYFKMTEAKITHVHASEIQGDRDTTLAEGQKVKYEVGQGKKGPCAVNVIPN